MNNQRKILYHRSDPFRRHLEEKKTTIRKEENAPPTRQYRAQKREVSVGKLNQ